MSDISTTTSNNSTNESNTSNTLNNSTNEANTSKNITNDSKKIEQNFSSIVSKNVKNNVDIMSKSQDKIVNNEIPLLIYSYLKSTGLENMADRFLEENMIHKLKKYNLSGQPIDMTVDECKAIADSIEPNRLVDIVGSMKTFVEHAQQTDNNNKDENNEAAPSIKQTVSCSLITPAKQNLFKLMDSSVIQHTRPATSHALCPLSENNVGRINNAMYRPNLARLLVQQKFTGRCDLQKIYDACEPYKNLRLMKRILGHISAIYCFTLDRTKCTLFTGGEDGLIKIWNIEKCVLVATLRGHIKAVNDLSINHKNDTLASCGVDGTTRIWCLESCALLHTLRNGHNSSVISVCFSPYPVGRYRYLISTGLNGTLCFYKIDNDGVINENPIKFAEKQSNKQFRINCFTVSPGGTYIALAVNDPTIRVYKMGIKGPVRTMELYGHSDEVTSVEFDNYGSRFCSASKDGTICIWTLSITSWKCAQIDVKKDMKKKTEGGGSKKKNNYTINLATWSCNNKHICCACADFIIRIYDPCTKQLISRMSAHTDTVTVIHHHPTVGNVVLSSGCDGHIYLWNSDTGQVMISLANDLGELGFGSVYDMTFIANGRDFVMCDYHGNWGIYSSLPNGLRDEIPTNQFFHSDYWELTEDPASGQVLDVLYRTEPHLMPPPMMVNYFGIPYNNDVQKLIPGAALLDKETEFNYNHINLNNDTTVSAPGLATSGTVEGVRKTGIINKKNRSYLNRAYLLWFQRLIVNKLSQTEMDEDFEMRLKLYKHEQSIHNNVRNRASDFYDKEERVGRLLHLQSLQKQRKLEKESRRVVALPISNSQNCPTSLSNDDDEVSTNNENVDSFNNINTNYSLNDDFLYDFGGGGGGQSEQNDNARNSDQEFIDESDEFYSGETLPRRTNRTARLRSLRPRNSTGTISTRRNDRVNTRSAAVGNESAEQGNTGDVVEEVIPPVPDDYPSLWVSNDLPKMSPYVPQFGDEVYYFIQGHRLYTQELFQQNLTNLLPSVNAYEEYDRFILPEVNPCGYELCRVVDIQYIYKNPLICKIKLKRLNIDIYSEAIQNSKNAYSKDYFVLEFHDMANILDFIVLRDVVDTALKREWTSGYRFKSVIDDCWWYGVVESCSPNDSEFPQSPHLSYVIRWDTGEYDRVSPWDMELINSPPIHNNNNNLKNHSANFMEKNQIDKEYILDSFDVTSRLIDEGSDDSISSSSCVNDNNNNNRINNNLINDDEGVDRKFDVNQQSVIDPIPVSQDEVRTLCEFYNMEMSSRREDAWKGEEPFHLCERIANAIENFKNHYIAYAFSMPVDLVTFANYWTIVPLPLDLSKVISRLRNHYYRSKDAIIFDIKLIKLNALSYNKASTPISQCACTLFTVLQSLINENEQYEVDLKHPLLAGKRYPTDVTEPTPKRTNTRRTKKVARYTHYSDDSDDDNILVESAKNSRLNKLSKLGSSDIMVAWITGAFDLLNYLMNLKDSECFLHQVDLEQYPEYTQFVRHPMDFNLVLNKLKSGTYIHPIDLIDDIKLIFSNSRAFNTNPRSKIYSMTARLSNQCMARAELFLNDWTHIAPLKRPLTRSIIRNIYNNYLASQNLPVSASVSIDTSQATSSRRAALLSATQLSDSETNHNYGLRRSSNMTSHRYATRTSTSSYSPVKLLHDKESSVRSNESSFYNESTNNSSCMAKTNKRKKSNNSRKRTYDFNNDDSISSISSLKFPSSDNKNVDNDVVCRGRTNAKDRDRDDEHRDLSPDNYFGDVSSIANTTNGDSSSSIRRSDRVRKRQSYLNDSYSIAEEQNDSKYNLRRPKKRSN